MVAFKTVTPAIAFALSVQPNILSGSVTVPTYFPDHRRGVNIYFSCDATFTLTSLDSKVNFVPLFRG